MQLLNTKDYYEIKPITSSRFEIDIIHIDRRLFYYTISSPTVLWQPLDQCPIAVQAINF